MEQYNVTKEEADIIKVSLDSLYDIIDNYLTPDERRVCENVLSDSKFRVWPASPSKHHTWKGGLAQHTNEVVKLTMTILGASAVAGKPVKMNVGIMGALFHDFGKTDDYEIKKTHGVETTSMGASAIRDTFEKGEHFNLIHHVVKSSDYFLSFSESLDKETRTQVQHCILAHHGRLDYGSPVIPKTREAWAVHLADMASVYCIEQRVS